MNINRNKRNNKNVKINSDILLNSPSNLLKYYRGGMEIERPIAMFLPLAITTRKPYFVKKLFEMKFKNSLKPITFSLEIYLNLK